MLLLTRLFNRRSSAIVASLGFVAWLGSHQLAFANDAGATNGFLVSAFDCYLPVPSDFVLNTHETRHFALFRQSPFDSTRIVISEYRGDLDEVLEKIESREVDGLTIEELRYRQPTGNGATDRVVRIHDGKQAVRIYAPSSELVDSLVNGCLRMKREVSE